MPKDTYSVIVTGFGANLNAPYGNNTSNPSSLVASVLPHSIPPSSPFNPTTAQISIIDPVANDFAALPGVYSTIRQRIKELHEKYGREVDLWVHLGRGPWSFVTCERRAFRAGFTSSWMGEEVAKKGYYSGPDNEKMNAGDLGECPWREAGVPMGLDSQLDINVVVEGANQLLKTVDNGVEALEVRSHVEAGAAGCGFAFYESLANAYVAGRRRDVLFCHVPRGVEEGEVERAKDAVLTIVGACVASIIAREGAVLGDWKQEFGKIP